MLPLIAIFTFAAVALGTLVVARPRQDPLRRRSLGPYALEDETPPSRPRLQGSIGQRILVPLIASTGRLFARLLPQHIQQSAEQLLIAANEPWSVSGFLGVTALCAAFGAGIFLYIILAFDITGLLALVLGLVVLPLSAMLPYSRVRNIARKRKKSIIRALPDAMDLLVTSVEAGLGVDAAFAMVAEKTHGPLAETLSLYLRQVGLGRPRSEALTYVAERTGVPDLIRVARSVNQGTALGTPIADVLRVQGEELRVARRQRAQIAAQRAPVLMTIPLALCFLPATAAVVIVPSIMNLMNFIGKLGK